MLSKFKNHLTKEQMDILRDIFATAKNSLVEAEFFLFGSYAKGTARPDSDIDIMIKGESKLPLGAWSAMEESFQNSDLPQKVDLIDFHRVSEDFQRHILENSVKLTLI